MTPRPAGLTAPFRWLIAAVDVGRQQPQAVIGAVIAAVLASFLPTLPPQLMAALGSPPGPLVTYLFQGLGFAVGVLLVPVIMAGVYRVMDGAERGQPVHAAQVMDGFRDGSWGRLVAVALLSMLVNIGVVLLMIAVALAVVGTESLVALQAWIERVMALQAESGAGRPVPPEQIEALGLPPGLGGLLGVVLAFVPLWLVVTIGAGWALVSVALRDAAPLDALLGGLRASVLNAPALLVLLVALALPLVIVGGLLAMLLGVVMSLLMMLSQALAALLMLAAWFVATLVMTALWAGFLLNGWRAACDDAGAGDAPRGAGPPPTAGFEA